MPRSASGAVILTVLRLIQGIGVGGELGGAVCRSAPPPLPLPASGEREGPLAHQRCATRQAHARVRREGREGEGQRATDLGRLGEEKRSTGQPWVEPGMTEK